MTFGTIYKAGQYEACYIRYTPQETPSKSGQHCLMIHVFCCVWYLFFEVVKLYWIKAPKNQGDAVSYLLNSEKKI